ncbi:hypothetical protein YC2023_089588 [Brassica napus]
MQEVILNWCNQISKIHNIYHPKNWDLHQSQKGGIYANENLCSQYSSAVSSSLDVANTSLLTSVNREITNSFKFADLDQILFVVLLKIYPFSLRFAEPSNDACSKINSMIIPCCEDLIEPKSDHSHNIVEITNNTGKYLLDENLLVLHDDRNVDFGANRWINLRVQRPGKDQTTYQALSPLRYLEFQYLRLTESVSRWETANGDAKEQQHLIRAFSVYAAAVSDSRSPLSAVN